MRTMPQSPRYAVPELSERVQRLLGALVKEYIEHGEPVSSQWLAGHAGCAVSSATVRNVLARLTPATAHRVTRCSIAERFMWSPSVSAKLCLLAEGLLIPQSPSFGEMLRVYRRRAWRLRPRWLPAPRRGRRQLRRSCRWA